MLQSVKQAIPFIWPISAFDDWLNVGIVETPESVKRDYQAAAEHREKLEKIKLQRRDRDRRESYERERLAAAERDAEKLIQQKNEALKQEIEEREDFQCYQRENRRQFAYPKMDDDLDGRICSIINNNVFEPIEITRFMLVFALDNAPLNNRDYRAVCSNNSLPWVPMRYSRIVVQAVQRARLTSLLR